MKTEKPILFSSSMVKAILEGRKTVTRRVINPQPPMETQSVKLAATSWIAYRKGGHGIQAVKCPYGSVGSRLWVRETWQTLNGLHGFDNREEAPVLYRADNPTGKYATFEIEKWFPSIFMPRWASRINLEITGIRVERLNEISEEGAIAEGMEFSDRVGMYTSPAGNCEYARWAFWYLWDSINGKRPGCKWQDNPWVWVVEFKQVEATR